MSKQEQSMGKHRVDARQADTRQGSKRVLYISTALGIVALLIVLWWVT